MPRNKIKQNLFIISGPSGAGEDSIIDGISKIFPIERVITTTTRDMRPGESQSQPYYFVKKAEFEKNIKAGNFFEWAQEYNDHLYGVTRKEINRVKNADKIGIWKIEYKGVITAKKLMPEIVAIFINAPLKDLANRIRRRDNVTDDYVAQRISYTKEWLKHKSIYDYTIDNMEGKLAQAIEKTASIIRKEAGIDKKDQIV
ncbi:MAG: hypothetical protein Q8Q23_02760 [bacterium]|nr:hypothetical protein [bacterium]